MSNNIKPDDLKTAEFLNTYWGISDEYTHYSDYSNNSLYSISDEEEKKEMFAEYDKEYNITDMQELVNDDDKESFIKLIKENDMAIKKIGYNTYNAIKNKSELNLLEITNENIDISYQFKINKELGDKLKILKNVSVCHAFPMYKRGDPSEPKSYRYFLNHHNVIKLIDRLWCIDVINKCRNNLPDRKIFKSGLLKLHAESIISIANKNTKSRENVVLLDIKNAFDSVDWQVLEFMLKSNFTKRMGSKDAIELVDQYMTILRNRDVKFKEHTIKVARGIPVGLPSSNVVFGFLMNEIIERWLAETKYKVEEDFILNIYVDDIYFKFIKTDKLEEIIKSFISFFERYNLFSNMEKLKGDINLKLDIIQPLLPSDFYLGIPFTRDIKLYGQLILEELGRRKNIRSWEEVGVMINSYNKRKIIGSLNYKLKPLLKENENVIDFVNKHYIVNMNYIVIIYTVVIMIFMCFLLKIENLLF